jgi:hypothetical protein
VFTSTGGLFASVVETLPQGTFGPNAYVEGTEITIVEIASTDSKFQLDLGVDLSALVNTACLSAIYFF